MHKGGLCLFYMFGQSDPDLKAVQVLVVLPQIFGRTLGVYHTFACGHPVDFPWLDLDGVAKTVPMEYRSIEQIGKRRKPDVRMRRNIDVLMFFKTSGAHVIDKYKRSYCSLLPKWQESTYHKVADIGC